jgi:hypothetical protein
MTEPRVRRRALRRIVDVTSVTDYVAFTDPGARQVVKLVSLTVDYYRDADGQCG